MPSDYTTTNSDILKVIRFTTIKLNSSNVSMDGVLSFLNHLTHSRSYITFVLLSSSSYQTMWNFLPYRDNYAIRVKDLSFYFFMFSFSLEKILRDVAMSFSKLLDLNNLPNFARRHQYKWLMDREPALNLGALKSVLCLPKPTLDKSDNIRMQVLEPMWELSTYWVFKVKCQTVENKMFCGALLILINFWSQ